MNFYSKIAGLALGISFLGMTAVQASVPQDALAAGGIAYGASESYVRSIYGAPREVETKYDSMYAGSHVTEWEYGSDFDITFVAASFGRLRSVRATASIRRITSRSAVI
jgi:hypothetical protein